jgi:hypothetical protein
MTSAFDMQTQQALERVWSRLDDLVDRVPDLSALRAHGLALLAARRWRETGREVPRELLGEERYLAMSGLSAAAVLARARAAYGERMLLFKGPLVAARYPGGVRGFNDLDLLVDDANAAQAALIRGGFHEVDDPVLFEDIHHLRPLMFEGLPLKIEIHHRPKWPDGFDQPSTEQFFAGAEEGFAPVPGLLSPAPEVHILMLAAHAWGHGPLRSLRDLADVAVMSVGMDQRRLEALAAEWGLGRLWRTTHAAVESVFGTAPKSFPVRVWARHLGEARERTVLETHLEHWLSPFWGLPARRALAMSGAQVSYELRPVAGESWRDKVVRVAQAARRAFTPRSEHDRKLGDLATRGSLQAMPGEIVFEDVALRRVAVGDKSAPET